ncbi:hypothetical protein F5887DRAFT_885420 [Amanita rubescens]|nr:hypothetical protein F5887DRAFT_885420 [Amanita rubescens]
MRCFSHRSGRGIYCSIVTVALLDFLAGPELLEGTAELIASCQTSKANSAHRAAILFRRPDAFASNLATSSIRVLGFASISGAASTHGPLSSNLNLYYKLSINLQPILSAGLLRCKETE